MADDRRHPTDAEREAAARPTVAALLRSLEMRDPDAMGALLRDDVAWLSADGTEDGAAALRRARAYFADDQGRRWADPQQRGAHAVLRWGDTNSGAAGALVVEVRGDTVVFVCEVP
jgi:ketosteroid isomerase-like protein